MIQVSCMKRNRQQERCKNKTKYQGKYQVNEESNESSWCGRLNRVPSPKLGPHSLKQETWNKRCRRLIHKRDPGPKKTTSGSECNILASSKNLLGKNYGYRFYFCLGSLTFMPKTKQTNPFTEQFSDIRNSYIAAVEPAQKYDTLSLWCIEFRKN